MNTIVVDTNKGPFEFNPNPKNMLGCLVRYSNKGSSGNAKLLMKHATSGKRRVIQWDNWLSNNAATQASYHLALAGVNVKTMVSLKNEYLLIIDGEDWDKFNDFMYDK